MAVTRRELLFGTGGAVVGATPLSALAAQKIDVRLWPEDDQTRVTIELDKKYAHSYGVLRGTNPIRTYVDISGITLSRAIEKLSKATLPDNHFIARIRTGQVKPGVVRFTFDMKSDARVDLRYSKPVANYNHRLILSFTATNADLMKKVVDSTSPADDPLSDIVSGRQKAPAEKPNKIVEKRQPAKHQPERKNDRKGKTEQLIVVIDAGHGGEDPGAVGRGKTYEKNVVLAIAKKLEAGINRTKGMRAIMTRRKDVFLPLSKRAGVAVKEKAHIFISLHADAWTNRDACGSSVFTLSTGGASSLNARWLAQTQNRADEIGGIVYKDVAKSAHSTLVDMLAETKLRYGMQLGDEVLSELAKLGPLHKSSVESAEFAVLKAQGVPSILIETAFISNPKEEARLRDTRQQARFADAILQGIRSALRKDPSLLRQG